METDEYHSLAAAEDQHWWFLSLHDLVLASLRAAGCKKPARLLDAGCGTGGLALRLAEFGLVDAFDASNLAVSLARERGVAARLADLNTISLKAAQYDAVTCIDVLYHRDVADETRALNELARSLKPGGLLLLHLPAFEWLRGEHDRRVHTRHRYRLAEVEARLKTCGLNVEHASYRVMLPLPGMLLARAYGSLRRRLARDGRPTASRVRTPPTWINLPLTLVGRVENEISRRFRLPFGSSLYVLARAVRERR